MASENDETNICSNKSSVSDARENEEDTDKLLKTPLPKTQQQQQHQQQAQYENIEEAPQEDESEDATITNYNVNNETAVWEHGPLQQKQHHSISHPIGEEDENIEKHTLLTSTPAGSDEISSQKSIILAKCEKDSQHSNDDVDVDDEESTLIATSFELPYTAPLAPFDMELIERLRKEREDMSKRRHSRSSSGGYRRERPTSSHHRHSKSTDSSTVAVSAAMPTATTVFMERERLNSDAAGDSRQHRASDHERAPAAADRWGNTTNYIAGGGGGGDSEKPSTMANANDDSICKDSTISTLLLQDDSSQSCQIFINQAINHHNHHNNNRSKTPAIEEVQMTQLAPFEEPPADVYAPNEFYLKSEKNPSLFFDDEIRSIDFVLVYKINQQQNVEEENTERRKVFETNLEAEGLEIERVSKEREQIYFIKIHAPLEVLRRYSEILKLRMPMKELMCNVKYLAKYSRLRNAALYISKKIPGMSVVNRSTQSVFSSLKTVLTFFMRYVYVNEKYFPRVSQRFTAIYSRDKEYLFDVRHTNFFTAAVRSRIVQFILDRQRFTPKSRDEMAFGIERLVAYGSYCAAYPLHDGELTEKYTMRNTLHTHWASIFKWYRYQPLDYIKEYFGVKIGLYFAWLGFYTYMLLLASVVGVLCFIYSWSTLKDYAPVQEICSSASIKNITMCPLCEWCDFWTLDETCFYGKITYLIDNPSTVFFTIFMSFWATLFLELWKRYSAEITHRWDLTGFDVHEEHPRPQYLAKLQHLPPTRTDYVTNMKEPTVPFWRMKLPAAIFSFSVVLLLIALAFIALVAVIVYRLSMMAALTLGQNRSLTTSEAIMLTTASAAFVNLCFLYVLNYLYNQLAEYLTELEMWRTQTQFDDSLTLKIYLLQFVNYYASIFYIAFFKGKFIGFPGKYNVILSHRQEECSLGGCLTELCIQLAIIMIGKQAFNSILEVIMPMFWRKVMSLKVGITQLFSNKENIQNKPTERWFRDLKLLDWGTRSLFPEYLEMVLQYGFVTIFVAAFPLAPFFALLNNILEMRLDAKKLLRHHRRPVSQRVRDIGVWYRILDCIGKLSVITNGFIIAFTSDMIPRWVYRGLNDGTLNGYLESTLSRFHTKDGSKDLIALSEKHNVTVCYYTDYREPNKPYHLSAMFYIILACRLGFVVAFENFVALVMILVRWCIPDMTVELRDQIRREAYITNEIIIEQEARRARTERAKGSSSLRLPDSESNTPDPNDRFIRIEQLLCSDLSQSQMDLIIHGSNTETGIQGDV